MLAQWRGIMQCLWRFYFFFSEILNLVIFKVQLGLLNGLKNVGLRIAAQSGPIIRPARFGTYW